MYLQINITPDGTKQYPRHKHARYEIMTYLDGEGYLCVPDGRISFKPGTVIIVPPDTMHGSVSENGFCNISIEGDFESYLHLDSAVSLLDSDSAEGRSLASMIYNNRYGDGAYLSSLCTAYVFFIMQRLEIGNTVQRSIERITREISENAFDPEIDLARILASSGYSEDYIRACFKQITGKTPTDFLTDIRIKHACFMIDIYKHDLSLSEIAERCGYLDYIYFSKRFKENTGMSPRAYKQR